MDKTIEVKFFEAFKRSGVVNKCIDWLRYTYNLPPMRPKNNEDKQLQDEARKVANKAWARYYKEVLPKEIKEATAAFDDGVVYNDDSPLMNEIEANLNECQTDTQRERYLFSLLKPFGKTGCGFARVFTPIAEIDELNAEINKTEKCRADYQAMPQNEQLRDVNGKPCGTPQEQIEACDKVIKRLKEQIGWELHVNAQFCDLICGSGENAKWMQENTVEHCLHSFVHIVKIFTNRLDALLLTYGIDLMQLQNKSGLYLKRQRLITDVVDYIGSKELAEKYIKELPQEPQQEQAVQSPKQEHSQQEVNYKSTRGGGRPKEAFKDKMIGDADGSKLQRIHVIMVDKKGKDAALIILACIKKGWITKPTYTQVNNEFGDIGSKTGYNRYLNEKMFTKEELEGAINSLI